MSTHAWSARLKPWRADACALAVLAFFFAFFFARLLLPESLYPVSGDSYFYDYPLRVESWRMLRAGRLPLWTPHLMSGYPLLSMAQAAIGYPLTWGYLFLPGHVAETIYVLAPFLLAPIFTYAYARQIERSRAASICAGLTFGWGGAMVNMLAHNGQLTNAIAWLPLVLVCVERARTRPFVNCLVGATAAYAMSVFNGFGQGFVFVGLVVVAYGAFLALCAPVREDRASARVWERWRPAAIGLLAPLLAAGLCAFQIFETLRAARRSVRSRLTYETFGEGSFTLRQALESFALPLFPQTDVVAYVAPLAFALATVGAWCALRRAERRRDPRPLFWLCVAAAAFVLMLGATTPLYRLVYQLPVLSRFRVPSRHTAEWTFSLAILAAYGFDFMTRKVAARAKSAGERAQFYRRAAAVLALGVAAEFGFCWYVAALNGPSSARGWSVLSEGQYALWKLGFTLLTFAAVALAWAVRAPRWRNALLISVIVIACFCEPFILFKLWWRYVRKPTARFSTPAAATRFALHFPQEQGRFYTRVYLFWDETIVPPRVDAPNVSAVFGVQDVAGYEPLMIERYSRALGVYLDTTAPRPGRAPDTTIFEERSHVLDLLNNTFVAVLPETGEAGARALVQLSSYASSAPAGAQRWQAVYNEDGLLIVRNRRALPRAWLVAEAEATDGETALRRIRGEDGAAFDPRRTALLEDAPGEIPPLPGGEAAADSRARVAVYEPSRLVIETEARTPTLLVLSEIFYPGWEATVDGRPERIRLTDFLLRGVYLPAGAHRVEMRYAAPQARNGAVVSVLTLLVLGGLMFEAWRRSRTDGKSLARQSV